MGKPHDAVYGIPVKELSRILRCSLKTAHRYKTGQSVPDYCALAILVRDLGCFAPEWAGWTVNGEDLVAPSGWCVNRNDALIVPLMHGQIAALRAEVRDLKESGAETAGMDEQPEPGELPQIISNTG